jgi:hypothetical protein
MDGVDPMLSAALGSRYGDHDRTSWAGTFMADVMGDAGYVQTKKKAMPEGCVARQPGSSSRDDRLALKSPRE